MSKLSRAEKKALKKQQNQLEVKDTCVNCEQFIALDQRFCSHCGGKRIYNKLTWRNLLEDFVDRFFNLENSFLKTFVAMFRQPEDVIGGYINGMRKKYLPAFSYFAIAITLSGFYSFILKGWFLQEFISAQSSFYGADMASVQVEMTETITNTMMEYQSIYMFLSIPIMALISKLVFWNYKNYNLVEHFVIYLYTYSHISIISVTLNLLFIWNTTLLFGVSIVTVLLLFVFTAYVLKRLYQLDNASVILKSSLFLVVMLVFSCFSMFPLAIYGAMQGAKIAKGETKDFDENSLMGKMLKPAIEQAERKKALDSIKQDSLKRLEYELEITPDMIKNRPQ